jgi:CYTH domain-containing protein
MNIDPQVAAQLGFPKSKYMAVERERRWLCREVPRELVVRTESITDLYVTGARLRLREALPTDGSAPMRRLTRKADVNGHTRLITSIYLPEEEFSLLAATLQGPRIRKLRHRLDAVAGTLLLVDEFQGELAGLVVAEAEFETQEQLEDFAMPPFAVCELTDDPAFAGGRLANEGLPGHLRQLLGL